MSQAIAKRIFDSIRRLEPRGIAASVTYFSKGKECPNIIVVFAPIITDPPIDKHRPIKRSTVLMPVQPGWGYRSPRKNMIKPYIGDTIQAATHCWKVESIKTTLLGNDDCPVLYTLEVVST